MNMLDEYWINNLTDYDEMNINEFKAELNTLFNAFG